MARAERLDLVSKAISSGRIEWKDACLKRFRDELEMLSFTRHGVNESLQEFVNSGNQFKSRRESETSGWFDESDPYWYFAVIPAPGVFKFGLFVKVKLLWEDGDEEDAAAV